MPHFPALFALAADVPWWSALVPVLNTALLLILSALGGLAANWIVPRVKRNKLVAETAVVEADAARRKVESQEAAFDFLREQLDTMRQEARAAREDARAIHLETLAAQKAAVQYRADSAAQAERLAFLQTQVDTFQAQVAGLTAEVSVARAQNRRAQARLDQLTDSQEATVRRINVIYDHVDDLYRALSDEPDEGARIKARLRTQRPPRTIYGIARPDLTPDLTPDPDPE